MRLRSVACCLALVAIVRASAPGTEKPEPVQALDPITVTAMPLPLVKLDLGFHLSTGRFASAAVAEGGYIYVIGGVTIRVSRWTTSYASIREPAARSFSRN